MLRFAIVLLLILSVNCQSRPRLPETIKAILEHVDGALDQVIDTYNSTHQEELKKFQLNKLTDAVKVFQGLLSTATSLVDQTSTAFKTASDEFTAALKDLVLKIAQRVAKNRVLRDLVVAFRDARAVIQAECQSLQNLSSVAVVAIKDLTRAKLNVTLREYQLLIKLVPAIVLDPSKATNLAEQIADLRAQARVYESLKTNFIPNFIDQNEKDINKCFTALQERTVEFAYGLRANFTALKNAIGNNFKRRLANLTASVVNKGIVIAKQIEPVFDHILNTVSFVLKVELDIDQSEIIAILQAALEAITGGIAMITPDPEGLRVVIQAAKAYFPTPEDLKDLYQKFEQKIEAAGSLYNQFKQEIGTITAATISNALTELKKDIDSATESFREAQAVYHQKFKELAANITRVKSLIYNTVQDAKQVVLTVLEAKQAEFEATISDVKSQLQELKARIPNVKAEIRKIQETLLEVETKIKTAVGEALDTLKAQKEVLIDALKAKAGELQQLQDLVASQAAELVELVKKLEEAKREIAQNITAVALYALNASAAHIQDTVKSKFDKIKTGVDTMARFIDAGIQKVNSTAYRLISDGVVLTLVIEFDHALTTAEQVIAAVRAILQAEFGTNQVAVNRVGGVKREAASTLALESQISPASPQSPAAGESLPVAPIAGIVIVVVVVIVIVVGVVVLMKKKEEERV